MGRLPCSTGADDDAEEGDLSREQRLADRLEEWRTRPDLCAMWVAFCTTSTLTLADGIQLAKTRRNSKEVLELLSGIGLAEESPPDHEEDHHDHEEEEEALVKDEHLWGPSALSRKRGESHRKAAEDHRQNQNCRRSGSSAAPYAQTAPLPPKPKPKPKAAPVVSTVPAVFTPSSFSPKSRALARAALSDPRDTNLAYFRHCVEISFKPWIAGDFATVGKIAKSLHGEVRYLQTTDGAGVVAKVVPNDAVERSKRRECNERQTWLFKSDEVPIVEDLWNEIAVLTYLQRSFEQCKFVVRLLGMFQDVDSTYLVTEYCEGGELFERVAYGDPLSEGEKKRYVFQLLQAVQYLHRHNVGHRDVSLENVLLRRGECVLIDFGQAARLRAVDGTVLRYYAEAGKRMYRAPEMYVPRERPIEVFCPADGAPGKITQVSYDSCRCEVVLPPGAVSGKPCWAEPHGYAVAPADVFASGVCAFVLIVGKPPWAVARDIDPTFSFIRRHGVPMLLQQWRGGGRGPPTSPPDDEEALLSEMLRVDPARRPDVDGCLNSPWLTSLVSRSRRHTA